MRGRAQEWSAKHLAATQGRKHLVAGVHVCATRSVDLAGHRLPGQPKNFCFVEMSVEELMRRCSPQGWCYLGRARVPMHTDLCIHALPSGYAPYNLSVHALHNILCMCTHSFVPGRLLLSTPPPPSPCIWLTGSTWVEHHLRYKS